MMPIRSPKNEYQGVNAHYNSYLQNSSDWETFHGEHITDLRRAISAVLPPGYIALSERSLQIREYHLDTGEMVTRRPKPDVTIFQSHPGQRPSEGSMSAETLTVIDLLDEDEEDLYYSSVVIYEVEADSQGRRPVTRLELLSPTNKVDEGRQIYLEKRKVALRTGVNLVEIDYLHQTEALTRKLPSYPRHEPDAVPYYIFVLSPIPSLWQGPAHIYRFGVETAIPVIEVPLTHGDKFELNLSAVYDQTFNSNPAFSLSVDYAELPLHFKTYSPADQERIRQRMKAVTEGT
jgi:hypothetical protein